MALRVSGHASPRPPASCRLRSRPFRDAAPQLRTLATAQPPALTSPARGRGARGRPGSCECSLASGCRPEERVAREALGPQLASGQALPPLAPPEKAWPRGQVTGGQQVPRPKVGIQATTFQLQPRGCPGFLQDSTLSCCGLSRGPCRTPSLRAQPGAPPPGSASAPSPGRRETPTKSPSGQGPWTPRPGCRVCHVLTPPQGPGLGATSDRTHSYPPPGLCSRGSGQGDGTARAQAWHRHPRRHGEEQRPPPLPGSSREGSAAGQGPRDWTQGQPGR